MKKVSGTGIWVLLMIVVIALSLGLWESGKTRDTISYTEFTQKYKSDEVKSIRVRQDNVTIEGTLNDGKLFNAYVPLTTLNNLITESPKNSVNIAFDAPNSTKEWMQLVPTVVLLIAVVVIFFVFMQQSQSGGGNRGVMNFGKSRAKIATPDKKKVMFKDVAGAEEEKEELAEIVDFLKDPKKYTEMGARIPKGVLLVGPPGTGKTLFAKAIAGEAGVPFLSISGSDFVEMFVGVGASRVRDLFEQAKKYPACIIFIDEIDAVGRQRGAGFGGGHDEREQTLNQLLVEMDGFGMNEGIIMIAATNRPDILDPALLRPGRFDRQIMVVAPDVKGREEILKVHTRNKLLSDDIKLDVLAKRTPGFSGADIENLTNEAALLAVRKSKKSITMEDMEEAITRVIAGPEKKSKVITEKDRKLTAYHEAGHAVVAMYLENADPVHQISIIPRGMAGGYTMHLPNEDRSYVSKLKLKDDMVGLLGGRIAEKLVIGDISTGAKNDIDRTSNIARAMVMEYGMSDNIGPISYGAEQNDVFLGRDLGRSRNFSEEIGAKLDQEVEGLIMEAYNKAEKLLSENIVKLHAVAQALLEKERLEANEFLEVFNNA